MIYGYARVSTNHQDTELQRSALESAGCDHISEEHSSGHYSNLGYQSNGKFRGVST